MNLTLNSRLITQKSQSVCSSLLRILTATGLVITINGYQSRVVDQCYRLPIMEQMMGSPAYHGDLFVNAFEKFNPHLGYLKLLWFGSSLFGLSLWMFMIYSLTLGICIFAIWNIRKSLFPKIPVWSDWLLVIMFTLCKAGNIGTNHLWEDHLLDRQIGFSIGWLTLAIWLGENQIKLYFIPILCGLMAIIHPGLGLLFTALWLGVLGASALQKALSYRQLLGLTSVFLAAMLPWAVLYLPQSRILKAGVEGQLFWELATELQGPQHMRPIFWRATQWYAAMLLYFLGMASFFMMRHEIPSRKIFSKILLWVSIVTLGLTIAIPAIEFFHDINITLAQPFRLATPLRGLMLVLILPTIVRSLQSCELLQWCRTAALILSLRNDMSLSVMLLMEFLSILLDCLTNKFTTYNLSNLNKLVLIISQMAGCVWLFKHDPKQGQQLILGGYLLGCIGYFFYQYNKSIFIRINSIMHSMKIQKRKQLRIAFYAWAAPLLAVIMGGYDPSGLLWTAEKIATKWRIYETPISDAEKMGFWIDRNLPRDLLILSPPRDKSLRLWSHRSVVLNVAGSPYQAEALEAWASRLQTLSGFQGNLAEFCSKWPTDRVAFETFYEKASPDEILDWADQFEANAIIVPNQERFEAVFDKKWVKKRTQGRLILWIRQEFMNFNNLP